MKIFQLNEEFSDETIDELLYLVHDKSHVIRKGEKNLRLEEVLKKKEEAPVLYRGVSEAEYERFKSGKAINYYVSASESKETAHKFGKIVITITEAFGFCYWKWLKNYYENVKKKDFSEFDSSDGQHFIDTAEQELEWILPYRSKFIVSRKDKFRFRLRPYYAEKSARAAGQLP
jgi:hypothetical protein